MKGNSLLVAALLVSSLVASRPEAHAGDGTKALGFLPQNTALVATWNLARSRNSPAGRDLIEAMVGNERIGDGVQQFSVKAGIDWKQDVDTVVLGMGPKISRSEGYVLIAEGRFDRGKILAAARAGGGFSAREYWGTPYYQSGKMELAFLDDYLVIARKGALLGVMDVFRGKARPLRSSQAFMALLRTADVAQDMWCVFQVPKGMRKEIAAETGGHAVDHGLASVDLQDIQQKQVRARVRLNLSSSASVVALGMLLRAKGPADETVQAMGLEDAVRTMLISRKDSNLDLTIKPSKKEMSRLGRFLRAWSS